MINLKYKKDLLTIFRKIKRRSLLEQFLVDLLTPTEWADIITRWQIVKRLIKGTPQRQIAKNLKVSIAKITRGSRELQNKRGGFHQVLKILKKKI